MAEVILAGYQKDPARPHMSIVRATVETHVEAVQKLVALCDEIIDEQEEVASYRLLKFDQDGIHVLSPDVFRAFKPKSSDIQWGVLLTSIPIWQDTCCHTGILLRWPHEPGTLVRPPFI